VGGFAVGAGGAGGRGDVGLGDGLRGEWVGHWFGGGARFGRVVVVAGEAGGVGFRVLKWVAVRLCVRLLCGGGDWAGDWTVG
jgi:hypothetical protein